MTYRIVYKGNAIKEYPHKLTCIVWLAMRGFVYEHWRFGKWIDPDFKIERIEKDD